MEGLKGKIGKQWLKKQNFWFKLNEDTNVLKFKDIGDLYSKLEHEIKAHQSNLKRDHWLDKCEYVFEIDNFKFYKYANIADLPLKRFERLQVLLIMLDNRLTEAELSILIDIASESLDKSLNALRKDEKTKTLQHAAWSIQEIKSRQNELMVNPEIFCQIAACSLIRHDENPMDIDKNIEREKEQAFYDRFADPNFFLQSGMSQYLPKFSELTVSWKDLWELAKAKNEDRKRTYQNIHTEIKSTPIPPN